MIIAGIVLKAPKIDNRSNCITILFDESVFSNYRTDSAEEGKSWRTNPRIRKVPKMTEGDM